MNTFPDARGIPSGTVLDTDIAIIGGGPTGITLALALAGARFRVTILESGGMVFDAATQALYAGPEDGVRYLPLDASRLRYLGGSTNHWGGWCRPLDKIDFEKRDWLPYSGWPFTRAALEPYYARAQQMVEAGSFVYDDAAKFAAALGTPLALGKGGIGTTYFQFSKMRGSVLPTHFGERYAEELKRISNLRLLTHANVTGLRVSADAKTLQHIDVATLAGNRFTLKTKFAVLGAGGIENARLLLASNAIATAGIGNANGLVGRFFADHPIPGNNATMVLFDGQIAPSYLNTIDAGDGHFRAALAPDEQFKRARHLLGALITVDGGTKLDALGSAAVATTAEAMGVSRHGARAFTLGCGLEPRPDPDRRITLTSQRDALGMPRSKLTMTISDADFSGYRETLKELGRQLLASRLGMLQIHHSTHTGWLSALDWGNHHMGTARMHLDPKQGVVDADLLVHGMSNLYVAGSSAFPTYGVSNPTMNLVALTLRLANHLKGKFR